jgi:hypothetical protein
MFKEAQIAAGRYDHFITTWTLWLDLFKLF